MSIETEEKHAEAEKAIPRPVMKNVRWPMALVWLVPMAAAVGAGIYFYAYFQERGAEIAITFADGTGIRPGDTKVMYRGVEVGSVEKVELGANHQRVVVTARLHRSESALAKSGTKFWIVRPEVSLSGVSGLSTILSGPYIELLPGGGPGATQFTGLDEPPQIPEPGLTIRVSASRIEQLRVGAPILYRGIQVGSVRDVELADHADSIWLTVLIEPRYAVLVRTTSVFWLVKGIDLKGGIFSGVQLKLDSLQALIEGGLAFSTDPKNLGQPAEQGREFWMYDEAKDEWTKWTPKILLPKESSAAGAGEKRVLPTGADALGASGIEH